MMDENIYIKPSKHSSDKGEKVGVAPSNILLRDLKALGHPRSPIKAIKAFCTECSGSSHSERLKCTVFRCPLWPLREGRNPYHAQSRHSINQEKTPDASEGKSEVFQISPQKEIHNDI